MTEPSRTDILSDARTSFGRGEWETAARLLEPQAGAGLDEGDRVMLAISRVRAGNMPAGLQALRDSEALSDRSVALIRRAAIAPLIHGNRLDEAAQLLELVCVKRPDDVLTLSTRASVLGRLERFAPARRCLERCGELAPGNPVVATQMIQLLLRSGEVGAAAEFALPRRALWPRDARLAGIAAMALERAGNMRAACQAGRTATDLEPDSPQFAAVAMRASIETGDFGSAVHIGQTCLSLGGDSGELRTSLVRALEQSGAEDSVIEPHLLAALHRNPADIRSGRSLARIELRSGRTAEAISRLTGLVAAEPDLAALRIELAHALSAAGRHAESGRLIGEVSAERPDQTVWLRMAAAMYSRAGDERMAQDYYQRSVSQRGVGLPGRLRDGLAGLWEETGGVELPPGRLDWAWSLAGRLTPKERLPDRARWHRDAIWGHLADRMILDWLECRADRAGEISDLAEGSKDAVQTLRSVVDGGRGVLLASAHVGAMFAGPAILAGSGLPFRWLASTPSLKSMRHSDTLISTTGQSERRVAARALTALKQGKVVVIALDGSTSPAAPRIPFEGRRIAWSDFGPRAVAATDARAFFAAPYWQGDRLCITLTPLPGMAAGQSFDDFAEAWKSAYLDCLRDSFTRGGRNLRLNGGFWRFVR